MRRFMISLACAGGLLFAANSAVLEAQSQAYTLDEAIALVKKKYDGSVVRAETVRQDDRTIHQIRILTADGRVRTVEVDAQTGIE